MIDSSIEKIIARTWWDRMAPLYPFFVTTQANRGTHPQEVKKLVKAIAGEEIDWITTGLVSGDRIWGFKAVRARQKFTNVLECNSDHTLLEIGEYHGRA